MRPIVAGIYSLVQYLKLIAVNLEHLRPKECPYCFCPNLHRHGCYYRKSDRESPPGENLNPIPIYRFRCPDCKRTCSTLPECIPPRRWYIWKIQQAAILLYFANGSFEATSKEVIPSGQTIRRWFSRLVEKFQMHASKLKSAFSWLGYTNALIHFWQAWCDKHRLSTAMWFLNNNHVAVP